MIQIEIVTINGREFTHTYSDSGYKVERDGIQYDDAIDPVDLERKYTETDILIDGEEATEEDYLEALARLGVSE